MGGGFSGEIYKEEMLNKLRKTHTNYQIFVVFRKPFHNVFLLGRKKLLFFFNPNNQQSSKVCPVEQS